MMRFRDGFRFFIFGVLLTVLAGCDTVSGVWRHAELKAFPDYQCMVNVFENSDENDFTTRRNAAGNKNKYYSFSYRNFISMNIAQEPQGNILYDHSRRSGIGQKLPQSYIDSIWPVMKSIEAELEQQCSVKLKDNVRVWCSSYLSCPK